MLPVGKGLKSSSRCAFSDLVDVNSFTRKYIESRVFNRLVRTVRDSGAYGPLECRHSPRYQIILNLDALSGQVTNISDVIDNVESGPILFNGKGAVRRYANTNPGALLRESLIQRLSCQYSLPSGDACVGGQYGKSDHRDHEIGLVVAVSGWVIGLIATIWGARGLLRPQPSDTWWQVAKHGAGATAGYAGMALAVLAILVLLQP